MAPPQVSIYDPNIMVLVHKLISRTTLDGNNPTSQRFQGTRRTIDLTPFFGDGSSIRTSKSVRDAAGGFVLTFGDQPYIGEYNGKQTFESLYGLIEPMDCVEIRFRHNPSTAAGKQPPIIMRGFVSNVNRIETMGTDGKPSRAVTITGQDYGKIWQMLQILYLPGMITGQDVLSGFKLFERYGGALDTLPASQFVSEVINLVVNSFIAGFMPANSQMPSSIEATQYVSVGHGVTSLTGSQNAQGRIYDILRTYGDVGPWNELFLQDDEDGVHCVYRAIPAMDLNGDLIQPDAPSPEYIDIADTDVISINVSRSDANVANFYWVRAPRFDLASSIFEQQFALQGADADTVLLTNYPNSTETLYGLRALQDETQQGADDVSSFGTGLLASPQGSRDMSMVGWLNDRRARLVAMNRDNVLYESGSMRIRGNEAIRAGMYVRLHRGTFTATYYVVKIDHDYLPFQGVFSTLTVERGTGFIERVKRGGGADSPYLAEMLPTAPVAQAAR